jgi:hypothetical protein
MKVLGSRALASEATLAMAVGGGTEERRGRKRT